MKISLRKRKTTEGYSLYIDYNTKEYRYEFLKLYLFDQKMLGRKLTVQEKNANKETMIAAEAIVGQKMEQYRNGVLKLYGISVKKKRQEKFLDYFDKVMGEREKTSSSNMGNWKSARKHLVAFIGERKIDFSDIDHEFLEGFKSYLLGADDFENRLAQNSAVSYFTKLRVVIKQAIEDKYFHENPLKRVKPIASADTKREFLTIEELKKLKNTNCADPVLKKAFLFSCLTGMRFSDINKLVWGDIQYSSETGHFIRFCQKKTKGETSIYISDEAFQLPGSPGKGNERVFDRLYYSAYKNVHLKDWFHDAGIHRKVTFHCGRHTFATLQLNGGTDVTVVSNLLGHRHLKTTQIYTKITNTKKIEAANRISLL